MAAPKIRPISDLRNNFTEVSKDVHETKEPVFFTKNGYADMVVMSMEAYEQGLFESEVYVKLKEAECEALRTDERHDHDELMQELRARISRSEGA